MSQRNQIFYILADFAPHRSDEFQEKLFGSTKYGLFRLGARIHELRKMGHEIKGWRDPERPALYYYQLIKPEPPIPKVEAQEQLFSQYV